MILYSYFGGLSAVSKPVLANTYSFCRIFQVLQDLHACASRAVLSHLTQAFPAALRPFPDYAVSALVKSALLDCRSLPIYRPRPRGRFIPALHPSALRHSGTRQESERRKKKKTEFQDILRSIMFQNMVFAILRDNTLLAK